jgi:hypothetical protein
VSKSTSKVTRARVDPAKPWALEVRGRSGTIVSVRMIGQDRTPGRGNVYMSIETNLGTRAYIAGKETLRAVAHMILYGIGDRDEP